MIDEIFEKFAGAFAENTMRAYRSDFELYSKWCANKGIPPIPATADNLAMYVDDLSQTRKKRHDKKEGEFTGNHTQAIQKY